MSWENDDPRVMPGAQFVPEGMSDPDWGRFRVDTQHKQARVGDPTQWGADVDTFIPRTFAATFDELVTPSAQIINVSVLDAYSRSWALLGNLRMPSLTWQNTNFSVSLEITMAVGQTQIVHQVMLESQPGATPLGICLTQAVTQGGPYQGVLQDIGGVQFLTRPFAIIGGLIGRMITARVLYSFESLLPVVVPGLPATLRTSLIVCPFAPGAGL